MAPVGKALQALPSLFLPRGEPTGDQIQQAGVQSLERGGERLQAGGVLQGLGFAAGPAQALLDRGGGLPAPGLRL